MLFFWKSLLYSIPVVYRADSFHNCLLSRTSPFCHTLHFFTGVRGKDSKGREMRKESILLNSYDLKTSSNQTTLLPQPIVSPLHIFVPKSRIQYLQPLGCPLLQQVGFTEWSDPRVSVCLILFGMVRSQLFRYPQFTNNLLAHTPGMCYSFSWRCSPR